VHGVRFKIMKHKREIPGWGWFIIVVIVFFVVLPFIESVFMRVPLAFFFLWIGCPCLAWSLRCASLCESLTSRGYSNAQGILVCIAVAISILFFAHYDHLRDELAGRHLDGYSVHYYEDIDEYGRRWHAAGASANSFSGKVILYLSQWVMVGMSIGMPVLTWKIASASISIQSDERRKRESNNCIDADGE